MHRCASVVGSACCVLLLSACGGGDSAPPTATATPVSAPSSAPVALTPTSRAVVNSTAPSQTAEPASAGATATVRNSTQPASTAATSSASPLSGSSSSDDGSGDITNETGDQPDTAVAGIDLARVMLAGDGAGLTVTFETHDALPTSAADGVAYHYQVEIVLPDLTKGYTLDIVYSALRGWDMGFFDAGQGSPEGVPGEPKPMVSERSVSATFPAAVLEDIQGPFVWHAAATRSTVTDTAFVIWDDYLPDSAGPPIFNTIDFVPFPQ
jgi:hypothetical protein